MSEQEAIETLEPRLDGEAKRRVLRARARALALAPEPGAEPGAVLEVMAFTLGGESYAVEARWVREVCAVVDLATVPCTPPFVAGILNLRGEVITVIDLKSFLDLRLKGLHDTLEAIVIEAPDMTFALLAGRVTGTRGMALAEMESVPSAPPDKRGAYLLGRTADGLWVLDVARMVADPRLLVDEKTDMDGVG